MITKVALAKGYGKDIDEINNIDILFKRFLNDFENSSEKTVSKISCIKSFDSSFGTLQTQLADFKIPEACSRIFLIIVVSFIMNKLENKLTI